jgi:peroxiredoxin
MASEPITPVNLPPAANVMQLPADLPRPADDGGARHLLAMPMPKVSLPSTSGQAVDLSVLGPGRTVLYCYPMTGRPGVPVPDGWDSIPGARGCTPESCGFRDHFAELKTLGADVMGISTQSMTDQQEAVDRLQLPFELLSDADIALAKALRLPTFEFAGRVLLKRLTLVVRGGIIEQAFYPVFPPDRHAAEVVTWLSGRAI